MRYGSYLTFEEYEGYVADLKEKGTPFEINKFENKIIVRTSGENGYSHAILFDPTLTVESLTESIMQTGKFPAGMVSKINDNVNQTKAVKVVEATIQKFPTNLFLMGSPRTGKTFAIIYAAMALFAQNKISKPYFLRANEIQKFWRNDCWIFDIDWLESDLLILDDLGSETQPKHISNPNQDRKALILELIDLRLTDVKPLFITTNLSTEQDISDRYEDRFLRRIDDWMNIENVD